MALKPGWKPSYPDEQPPRDYFYIPGTTGDDGVSPTGKPSTPVAGQPVKGGAGGTLPSANSRPLAEGEPYWDGRSRGPESLKWLAWNKANNTAAATTTTTAKPKPSRISIFPVAKAITRKPDTSSATVPATTAAAASAPSAPSSAPDYERGRRRRKGMLDLRSF